MNIIGIGTEIVECARVGKMILDHGEPFLRRLYTEREIRDCQARTKATEHFAGRFAAKEAVLKALGIGAARRVDRRDLEVRRKSRGEYEVYVQGAAKEATIERGVKEVRLSISHCRAFAVGFALALGAPVEKPN